jgi:hypothetical protein
MRINEAAHIDLASLQFFGLRFFLGTDPFDLTRAALDVDAY